MKVSRFTELTRLFVCDTLGTMSEIRVTMSGDHAGEFVVEEERSDGSLILVPVAIWEAERQRTGVRDATDQEWQGFLTEHAPHMQPPDGEG